MTTYPQRRNRKRLDPAFVTAWPPGIDLGTTSVGTTAIGAGGCPVGEVQAARS